jgi:hypothetical protein
MNTRVHYERPAKRSPHDLAMDRWHGHAQRLIDSGAYHVSLAAMRALGRGDLIRGEDILQQLFAMAAPRLIRRDQVRHLGSGSLAKGRKVLAKFFGRQKFADGGAVEDDFDLPDSELPEAEHHARGGKIFYERVPLRRSYGLVPQPDGGHLRQTR